MKNEMEKQIEKIGYRYQNQEERIRTMNRFMMIGTTVLFGVFVTYLVCKLAAKNISPMTVYGNLVLMAIFWIVMIIFFIKKPQYSGFKRISYIAFGIEYLLLALQTDAEFINIALLGLLVSCIPYYERKFFRRLAFSYSTLYVISVIVRALKKMTVYNVNFLCTTMIIILLFYTITRIGTISKKFSDDAMGAIADQSKRQQIMMEEILEISRVVQTQTTKSQERIEALYDSSEVVSQSMEQISVATETIAENVQQQTIMTQDVQKDIEGTITHSKKMVEIAKESNEDIQNNIKLIHNLKQQSLTISETNEQVTGSMEQLLAKTKEVQEIAGVIFSISNQTNMLALNASIESARAGEAGRGFAVVAKQIGQLAGQTRQATENISKILEELNKNAQIVVKEVESSVDAAAKQNEMILTASESFEKVDSNITALINDIDVVDGSVFRLADTNNQIVENISQISANTEEVTANAEEASNLSRQNLKEAQEVKKAIEVIRENTEKLKQYL